MWTLTFIDKGYHQKVIYGYTCFFVVADFDVILKKKKKSIKAHEIGCVARGPSTFFWKDPLQTTTCGTFDSKDSTA